MNITPAPDDTPACYRGSCGDITGWIDRDNGTVHIDLPQPARGCYANLTITDGNTTNLYPVDAALHTDIRALVDGLRAAWVESLPDRIRSEVDRLTTYLGGIDG